MKRWLNGCRAEHSRCSVPDPLFRPRRLIEICNSGIIKLIEPSSPLKYIALSYCWGMKHHLLRKTTIDNIAEHHVRIPEHDLPRGLLDAVHLAKQLEFRHIWIDALCITQGDDADLAAELPRMGMLYANADLVIAIDTVGDCTRSFEVNHAFGSSIHFGFMGRTPLYKETYQASFVRRAGSTGQYKPLFLRQGKRPKDSTIDLYIGEFGYNPENFDRIVAQPDTARPSADVPWSPEFPYRTTSGENDSGEQLVYVRKPALSNHMNASIQRHWKVLDLRGWTLQECRLATRLLTLSFSEMRWTCADASFCECREAAIGMCRSMDFPEKSPAECKRVDTDVQRKDKKQRELYHRLTNPAEAAKMQASDIYEAWERLVNDYSERKLTNIADRTKALEGITTIYERALRSRPGHCSEPFHGLWTDNIIRGLLWRSISFFGAPTLEFYTRTLTAHVPNSPLPSRKYMLARMEIQALPRNFLMHHAFYTGRPCFASSIYWPIVNTYTNPESREDFYPSWSWLSVFGTAKFWDWIYGSEEQMEAQRCTAIDFRPDALVRYVGPSPSVTGKSEIRLNCRVAPVRLKSLLHGPRQSTAIADFPRLYEDSEFDTKPERLPFLIPPLLDTTTNFANIEGSCTAWMLLVDSPCLFGSNIGQHHQDPNQWLIDLVQKEYAYRKQQSTQRREESEQQKHSSAEARLASKEMHQNYDFKEWMPCIDSEQSATTLRSENLCSDPTCKCKQRWTGSQSYPAKAVYLGAAFNDGEHGRRSIVRYALIVIESRHTPGAYQRMGIAMHVQSTISPGFHDPFANADWEEITVI